MAGIGRCCPSADDGPRLDGQAPVVQSGTGLEHYFGCVVEVDVGRVDRQVVKLRIIGSSMSKKRLK